MVKPMASRMAGMEPGSASCIGTLVMWLSGSATPQNMSTEPSPPAKSMANQDGVECSGRSPSWPKRMRPYPLTNRKTKNRNAVETPPTYSQFRFVSNQSETLPKPLAAWSGKMMVAATNRTMNPAANPKMVGSTLPFFFSSLFSTPAFAASAACGVDLLGVAPGEFEPMANQHPF